MYQNICSECGSKTDGSAASCPSCGAPLGTVCSECGALIPIGAAACLNCGAPVYDTVVSPLPGGSSSLPQQENDNTGSLIALLALIFAFFFPPVGLVLSIVGLASKQIPNKRKLKAALVISVITTAALTVFLVIFLPKAIRAYSTGKKVSDFFKGLFGGLK